MTDSPVPKQASLVSGAGADWKIFNTAGSWPRQARAQLYGSNDMATGKPHALSMAAGLLVYPVYVIQVSLPLLLPAFLPAVFMQQPA